MTTQTRTSFAKLSQEGHSDPAERHEMLYSGRVGGARAVFAFCDLSGLDLSGRNLADAASSSRSPPEAILAGAKLDPAGFLGASLKRANLAGASLSRGRRARPWSRGTSRLASDLYEADLREGKI